MAAAPRGIEIARMRIAAGKLPLGRCEALDGEGVVTDFFFIGPVLVPLDSIYVRGRLGRGAWFQVRRHGKSTALAYARWVLMPLALLVAVSVEETSGGTASGIALATVGAAWLALLFVAGRVHGVEARRRRVLAAYVGHAAPPEIFFDGSLDLALEHLEELWVGAAASTSYRVDGTAAVAWRELYPKDVPQAALPLYYALCRYAAAKTGEEVLKNRARLAWARIDERWAEVAPTVVTRAEVPFGVFEPVSG